MRLLSFWGLPAALCLFATNARADGQKLSADFPTAASHAELSHAACALSLNGHVENEARPIEIHAFEDGTQLCVTDTSYPNALVVRVQMVSRGDPSRVTLTIDAPADASPSVLADYRASLGVAEEAVHRAALDDATPDVPRHEVEPDFVKPAPTSKRSQSFVTAGSVMMVVASLPLSLVGIAIAADHTYPGTSQAWPFVPFIGMTVFSATYTEVADCDCPSSRPLSMVLSVALNAVQIAGLVLVLVGSTSSKKSTVAHIVTTPFGIGGAF